MYTGKAGTGRAVAYTNLADLLKGAGNAYLSASVINGGSFSTVVTFSDGSTQSWLLPAGTVGPVDAPSMPTSSATPTTLVITVNGQSFSRSASATASPYTQAPVAATFAPLNAPSVTFYTGKGGTGQATTFTSLAAFQSQPPSTGNPLSVSVANGGSFAYAALWTDGTTLTWNAPAGTVGAVDSPPFPTNKTFQSVKLSLNGQQMSMP